MLLFIEVCFAKGLNIISFNSFLVKKSFNNTTLKKVLLNDFGNILNLYPRQYNVNGVTFTVTPVYDGKKGVDIKKQFEKCVLNNVTDLYIDDSGGTIT